jgi:phospholipid/cholesterol/gamma-HCH transport system substrate-binding protein
VASLHLGGITVSRSLSSIQASILGIAVLLGLGLAGVGLFAVGNGHWPWTDAIHLRVGLRQIHGIEVGTPVRVLGRNAGEVEEITLPDTPDGEVTLLLRVDGRLRNLIRSDASAQIVPVGMVGSKVIEIDPGSKDAPGVEDRALIASRPMNDPFNEVTKILGTLDQEKDKVHDLVASANQMVRQGNKTMASIQQASDAVNRLPGFRSFVENTNEMLYRPHCERTAYWLAEADLFEPGRAQLSDAGRERLREMAPTLAELTRKAGAEMVVVAYSKPDSKLEAEQAQVLTRKQAEAVSDYLKQAKGVYKKFWLFPRKVQWHGFGVEPLPVPEKDNPPGPAVGILVFAPQT